MRDAAGNKPDTNFWLGATIPVLPLDCSFTREIVVESYYVPATVLGTEEAAVGHVEMGAALRQDVNNQRSLLYYDGVKHRMLGRHRVGDLPLYEGQGRSPELRGRRKQGGRGVFGARKETLRICEELGKV